MQFNTYLCPQIIKNRREMKKQLFFVMCFLLMIGSAGCSNDDDSNDIGHKESCISGEIMLFKSDYPYDPSLKDYISIMRLNMPEGDEEYNYIKAIVVLKDELPSRFYYDGTVIDFNIVEVKSTFPPVHTGDYPQTFFLCSIELCE